MMITLVFVGVLFIQSCKKENEVTVKSEIEDTWQAESVTTTYAVDSGDSLSTTDGDPDWKITFNDGKYILNGENDWLDGNGSYSVDGDNLTIDPDNGEPRLWKVEKIDNDELISNYTDSDEDGEFTVRIVFSK